MYKSKPPAPEILSMIEEDWPSDLRYERSTPNAVKLGAGCPSACIACQGDGTTVLPRVWDRVVPVAGRVVMVAYEGAAGQSDGVGWTGFARWGFWRCR
jgi:hypothetical protein